jgi:hypothetical protein
MRAGVTFAIWGDDPEVVEHSVELVNVDAVRPEFSAVQSVMSKSAMSIRAIVPIDYAGATKHPAINFQSRLHTISL